MSFEERGREVESLLAKHKGEIIAIPGVRDVVVLVSRSVEDMGSYLFNVIADPTVDQSKIPNLIEGIPTKLTLSTLPETPPPDAIYERVAAIKARHNDELLFGIEGAVSVATVREGYRQDGLWVIEVGVKDETAIKRLPKEIEGVKVVGKVIGEIRPLRGPCLHCGIYPTPVPMGVSTSNTDIDIGCTSGVGTLGFAACTGSGGTYQYGYVTNNHVAIMDHGCSQSSSRLEYQPALQDAPSCGLITYLGQPYSFVRLRTLLEGGNVVDAAFIGSSPSTVSPNYLDLGPASNLAPYDPQVGDKVYKSGRTTGATLHTVLATDASMAYSLCGTIYAFGNQISLSAPVLQGGDSGAALLDGSNRVVGLLYGASADGSTSYANRATNVMNALSIRTQCP